MKRGNKPAELALRRLERENTDVVKSGRTHLQDATPIRFSQEISGWRSMLESSMRMLEASLAPLSVMLVAGTAADRRSRLFCPVPVSYRLRGHAAGSRHGCFS